MQIKTMTQEQNKLAKAAQKAAKEDAEKQEAAQREFEAAAKAAAEKEEQEIKEREKKEQFEKKASEVRESLEQLKKEKAEKQKAEREQKQRDKKEREKKGQLTRRKAKDEKEASHTPVSLAVFSSCSASLTVNSTLQNDDEAEEGPMQLERAKQREVSTPSRLFLACGCRRIIALCWH